MKRPNIFVYIILGFILKIYSIFKGQKITKKAHLYAPCIVLSNHTSFPDFIYTTSAVYPKRINYLAADKMFYDPVLGFFLRLARAIPKCLFQNDTQATLKAMRILKNKGIIGIFPEGQISPAGVTLEFNPAISKFIKKVNVPVYLVKHRNAYLVNPPWSKKTFRGKIETSVELLFSIEDINQLSQSKINDVIQEKLFFNTHEYNDIKRNTYKVNDITNLESVIYQCPRCKTKELISKHKSLVCNNCNSIYQYDQYGQLGGYRIDVLYREQESFIQNEIDNNPDFLLESNVNLECYRGKKVIEVGKGCIKLSKNGYEYIGTIDGVNTKLYFTPKTIPTLPSDLGRNIQIYEGYQLYQFVFNDRRIPTQFVIAGEYLHKIENNKNIQTS
jgi:1-acyl-sn-glycerol-3-phosphate acyltransferase